MFRKNSEKLKETDPELYDIETKYKILFKKLEDDFTEKKKIIDKAEIKEDTAPPVIDTNPFAVDVNNSKKTTLSWTDKFKKKLTKSEELKRLTDEYEAQKKAKEQEYQKELFNFYKKQRAALKKQVADSKKDLEVQADEHNAKIAEKEKTVTRVKDENNTLRLELSSKSDDYSKSMEQIRSLKDLNSFLSGVANNKVDEDKTGRLADQVQKAKASHQVAEELQAAKNTNENLQLLTRNLNGENQRTTLENQALQKTILEKEKALQQEMASLKPLRQQLEQEIKKTEKLQSDIDAKKSEIRTLNVEKDKQKKQWQEEKDQLDKKIKIVFNENEKLTKEMQAYKEQNANLILVNEKITNEFKQVTAALAAAKTEKDKSSDIILKLQQDFQQISREKQKLEQTVTELRTANRLKEMQLEKNKQTLTKLEGEKIQLRTEKMEILNSAEELAEEYKYWGKWTTFRSLAAITLLVTGSLAVANILSLGSGIAALGTILLAGSAIGTGGFSLLIIGCLALSYTIWRGVKDYLKQDYINIINEHRPEGKPQKTKKRVIDTTSGSSKLSSPRKDVYPPALTPSVPQRSAKPSSPTSAASSAAAFYAAKVTPPSNDSSTNSPASLRLTPLTPTTGL